MWIVIAALAISSGHASTRDNVVMVGGSAASVIVSGAGTKSVDGEYKLTSLSDDEHSALVTARQPSQSMWKQVDGPWQIYTYGSGADAGWYIAQFGVVWAYTAKCASASEPPTWGWRANTAASFHEPGPNLTGTVSAGCPVPPPSPAPPPVPHYGKNCSCVECVADWGPAGCPDLHTIPPDLIRPRMVNATPAAGRRVRAVQSSYAHTQAYHALYLPTDWVPGRKYPVIVEYMGNGPWHDNSGDVSTGLPEDSNLGYGMMGPNGSELIWISMPFLTSDLGANTHVSTYWWGCPETVAQQSCGAAFNQTPTIDYAKKTIADVIENYGGDPDRLVITGWSRGAIACGAIGLADAEIARLWRAFIPYSHLDGDCGVMPWNNLTTVRARYDRLNGRPQLAIAECDVATKGGVEWLSSIGVLNGTGNFTFETTGFQNHNDAWVLRPSKGRDRLRKWLRDVLAD